LADIGALVSGVGTVVAGIGTFLSGKAARDEAKRKRPKGDSRDPESDLGPDVNIENQARRHRNVVLAAFGVVVTVVFGAAFVVLVTRPSAAFPPPGPTHSPTAQQSEPRSGPSSPQQPSGPKLRIAYPPHDGDPGAPVEASQQGGLAVRGSATNLQNEYVWLFDFDPEDNNLYEVSDSPIPVAQNGTWFQQDAPIGDPGIKKVQYVVVIRATAACNDQLKAFAASAKASDKEPFSFRSPPDGCVEDDRAPVNIAKP
jgi:hypothetical protein